MEWQLFVLTLVSSLLTSTVIAALVSALINHFTQIKAIKESGLYAKRANVLDKIMQRLERLNRLTGQLISPMQYDTEDDNESERRKKAAQAYDKFSGYYQDYKHYLNKKLCTDIDEIIVTYRDIIVDYAFDANPDNGKQNRMKWLELLHKHIEEMSIKRNEIAEEFRKIIGVK